MEFINVNKFMIEPSHFCLLERFVLIVFIDNIA